MGTLPSQAEGEKVLLEAFIAKASTKYFNLLPETAFPYLGREHLGLLNISSSQYNH